MNRLAYYIISAIGILLFQVLLLNRVELHGFLSPYIYPLIILLLPLETPKALQLFLAFIVGMTIDLFGNTMGMHAAALVFMAYIRPLLIHINRPISDYESSDEPTIQSLGFRWFLSYAGVAIFVHHFIYFFIEVFSFSYLFHTLIKIVGSAIISLFLIILYQYIFYARKKAER